jgi:flagellar basal-body rod modification protein FlgD
MNLNPVISSTPSSTIDSAKVPTTKGAKSATSDFKTFLTLLTTQLKNQDPLQPLKSTEFVSQLASFSAVEQQVRTNDTLGAIKALLGGTSATGLSSWIGTEVRVAKAAEFTGAPIDVYLAPDKQADRADLVVTNATGNEVQRLPIGLGENVVQWAGVAADGSPLAPGSYKLMVESFQGNTLLGSQQASVYARVQEARLDGNATKLVLADGTVIAADTVTAIRGPQAAGG